MISKDYLSSILKSGNHPTIFYIEKSITETEALSIERYFIQSLKNTGITNMQLAGKVFSYKEDAVLWLSRVVKLSEYIQKVTKPEYLEIYFMLIQELKMISQKGICKSIQYDKHGNVKLIYAE